MFFPPGSLYPDALALDAVLHDQYARALQALGEVPLLTIASPSTTECYRFLYTCSRATPSAVAVRLHFDRDCTGIAICKRNDATSHGEASRVLSQTDMKDFRSALEETAFWSATYDGGPGFDGSHWVFEGLLSGHLHAVMRFSPAEGPWTDLGHKFLQLGGFDPAGFW